MTDTESAGNLLVPCPQELLGLDPYATLKGIAALDQPSPQHLAWAIHCVSLLAEDAAESLGQIDSSIGQWDTERRKQTRLGLATLVDAATALMYAAEESRRTIPVTVFDLPGAEHLGEDVPEQ